MRVAAVNQATQVTPFMSTGFWRIVSAAHHFEPAFLAFLATISIPLYVRPCQPYVIKPNAAVSTIDSIALNTFPSVN
jgi:hypothetical protein